MRALPRSQFDPVTMKDYYALMGVFASTVRVERPTFAVEPDAEQEYMWLQRKLFDLAYSINLLGNEGTTFINGAEKAVKWKAEMESLKARAATNLAKYPQLIQSLDKYWNPPRRAAAPPPPPAAAAAAPRLSAPPPVRNAEPGLRRRAVLSRVQAAQYVYASDPVHRLLTAGKPGKADSESGNVAAPARSCPRVPVVLTRERPTFKNGSGRSIWRAPLTTVSLVRA